MFVFYYFNPYSSSNCSSKYFIKADALIGCGVLITRPYLFPSSRLHSSLIENGLHFCKSLAIYVENLLGFANGFTEETSAICPFPTTVHSPALFIMR